MEETQAIFMIVLPIIIAISAGVAGYCFCWFRHHTLMLREIESVRAQLATLREAYKNVMASLTAEDAASAMDTGLRRAQSLQESRRKWTRH